jgi:ATP phosphoribosyltransferase
VPDSQRIKIAIQKSGRLAEKSFDLLAHCGLELSRAKNQLFCYGENLPIDVLLMRDDDIPGLLQDGVCELGIVGENVVVETELRNKSAGWTHLCPLDFGRCRLSIAVPENIAYTGRDWLNGKRIATTYPETLRRFLNQGEVDAKLVTLSGAVEIAPRLGRADCICDLVSSGATLAANRLVETEVVLESRAALYRSVTPLISHKEAIVERFVQRLEGVLQVRESKYIMFHAPRSALAAIHEKLPGAEAPTVLPLEGCDDRVAVHAVCRESVFWETLEDLKRAGASAMLVLSIEKMLG